jgi:hypothetical protein
MSDGITMSDKMIESSANVGDSIQTLGAKFKKAMNEELEPFVNILDIKTNAPDNIKTLCDSKHVAQQHINLYQSII